MGFLEDYIKNRRGGTYQSGLFKGNPSRRVTRKPMQSSAFNEAVEHIFEVEGGYVNDPNDPGGETNYGISKRAHPNEDIKGMTKQRASEIYKKNYWDKIQADSLDKDTAMILMDFAVNSGTPRAARSLQRAVGADDDGIIGPKTLKKYKEFIRSNGSDKLRQRLIQDRVQFYKDIIKKNPNLKKFKRGWDNRISKLERSLTPVKVASNKDRKVKGIV